MNEPNPLGRERLLAYFTDHLNRICCAKTHLVKRLPEAAGLASFRDIRNAVDETREDVVKQIERMLIPVVAGAFRGDSGPGGRK